MTVKIDPDLAQYVRDYAEANELTFKKVVNALLEKGIIHDQKEAGVYRAATDQTDTQDSDR